LIPDPVSLARGVCRVQENVMEVKNSDVGISKTPSRGSWTLAQKQQMVAESNVACANIAEVAKRNGVRRPLLMLWRRQLSRMVTSTRGPSKFAAVRMSAAPIEGVIEIDLSGGCVRVRGIVDAVMLREVLAAAR
jgi:transposase-like protein